MLPPPQQHEKALRAAVAPTAPAAEPAAPRPRLRRANRRLRALLLPGSALLALALGAHGVVTGFGTLEIFGLVLCGVLACVVQFDRSGHWTPRLLIAFVVSGVMLLAVDLALLVISRDSIRPTPLRGLYTEDAAIGFRLTPNWSQVYRDRVVDGARYTVNALGHRDAMPVGNGEPRILLLGDSMTFGELLDQSETIDKQIEALSRGKIDAYNLAVPGYGAEASAVTLSRNALPATHALYFFYVNDLRNDGLATRRNRIWKDFLVAGEDWAGNHLGDAELDARVARELARPRVLRDALRLHHLFVAAKRARDEVRRRTCHDLLLGDTGPMGYRTENVSKVVDHTLAMQRTAALQGLQFAVVLLPSLGEATTGARYSLVDDYVARARDQGLTVVDAFDRYDDGDYFIHNGHFAPSGARKTAEVVVEWFGASRYTYASSTR